MAVINPINNTCLAGITVSGGAVSLQSGTSALNISTDASATTVSIGTGAAAKTLSIGSTTSTSSTAINSGSGNVVINSGPSIATTGYLTNTTQPSFCANVATSVTNVTGDATVYTVKFDEVIFNQVGGSYATGTGIYTLPASGVYVFQATVLFSGIAAGQTTGQLNLVTGSGYNINMGYVNPVVSAAAGGYLQVTGAIVLKLSASDTAYVTATVTGGSKVVGILGNAVGMGQQFSYFSAAKIA